jgi:CBS domain-containing protein
MTVRETMKRDLIVVRPDTTVAEAARLLIEHRITGLPVVDAQHRIVGVISEMDLMRTLAEPHRVWRVVAELMTSRPLTVSADAPLHEAFDCLMTHSFRRVLVEEEGRLVGLISRTDLLPSILEHLTHPPD